MDSSLNGAYPNSVDEFMNKTEGRKINK